MYERISADQVLRAGSTLLLYTDRLIEDRSQDIDVAIESLHRAFQAAAELSVDDLADVITTSAGVNDLNDDRCLLIVRTL